MTDLVTALERRAADVTSCLQAQDDAWGTSGWTRRRFLAGAGMAGVAALGTQLVTSRAAYSATPSTDDRTMVVVFLRGACDGLRVLVPGASSLGLDYLQKVRPQLIPATSKQIQLPGAGGWALNAAMQPLYDGLWSTGELAFVPAVSSPGISRSHFQAQQYLERGGAATATTGWLQRLIGNLGAGTTFRALAAGTTMPAAFGGSTSTITMSTLDDFTFQGFGTLLDQSQAAVQKLYRGVGGTLESDVNTTMSALDTAAQITTVQAPESDYPDGQFAASLREVAAILRAEVGLQVATIDVGGWDTHTDEATNLDQQLTAAAAALRAFMDDLGPTRRSRVTTVVMTEFGRRVMMNDSGGTDHGHGSVMWLLGGGLSGSGVMGRWNPLTASTLDTGDVPGLNSPFDVLGEIAQKRLNSGSLTAVFPGWTVTPMGVAKTL